MSTLGPNSTARLVDIEGDGNAYGQWSYSPVFCQGLFSLQLRLVGRQKI